MSEQESQQSSQVEGLPTRTKREGRKNGSSAKSRSCHWVLNGKGGCGKSLVASLLVQHFIEAGEPVVAFDTDPVQRTLSGVPALQAEVVEIFDDEHTLNVDAIDAAISRMLIEDANFVIDNGASSFVPLANYLLHDDVIDMIVESGKRVVVHVPLIGGQSMLSTALGFGDMAAQFPASAEFVLWMNGYFGDLVTEDGVRFEDAPVFIENKDRVSGMVYLKKPDPKFTGPVFDRMMSRRLTFAEARASDEFTLMARLRLANVWLPLKEQIANVV